MSIQFLDLRTSQAISYGLPLNTGELVSNTSPGTQVGGVGLIVKDVLAGNKNDIRVELDASVGMSSTMGDIVTLRVHRISNGVTTVVFQGNQVIAGSANVITGFTAADFQPTFPTNGQLVYRLFVQAQSATDVFLDGPISFNGLAVAGTFP
ncbi:hypothetical protein SAMN05444972_110164 [Marininema halotolerans]|uniref:Uncharacterized protein n=1 Tax=Marininema halotolerans TaxID=1155944 RepID=A0A1I6TNL1_9BACL|nr:hypothetical protein SAMN05444972_110164 [Marininema halotolerans]